MSEVEKVDPFALQTETLDLGMRGQFSFRELGVEELDQCREGATAKDGTINYRTMIRLMIVASSVDPRISLAQLAKLPQRVYAKITDFVDNLNDGASLDPKKDKDKDEDEGNS